VAEGVRHRTGIANARVAYQAFAEIMHSARFAKLAQHGAQPQRPLWASTSTKNPNLPDTYYVDALLGPDTVNTLPPETLAAYRDHGRPAVHLTDDPAGARAFLASLPTVGVDLAAVTRELEEDGVKKFCDSYDAVLRTVAEKQKAVRAA